MIDNMGKREATFENCEVTNAGVVSTGSGSRIILENRDPLVIDDYILGNNFDYVAIKFDGPAPSIVQEAFNGDDVSHEMVSIVPRVKDIDVEINPSPNSDLQEYGGFPAYKKEDLEKSGVLMLSTRKEMRKVPGWDSKEEVNVLYLIIQGVGMEIATSKYDETVLGTGRTRIVISFGSSTVIKAFVSGRKDLSFPVTVNNASEEREEEETRTAISKSIEDAAARSSVKGFTQKITKMFNINGGL